MYTRFFGFSEKPFHVTPDPKFLYLAESHQKALDALSYGISERKGFIAVSGEAGTGKTILLHHLLNTLDPKVKTVFISQSRMTPKQLLKEIIQKLRLTPKDQSKISLILQLNEYLVAGLAREENLAILMDEAQSLSVEILEELRMLSNLETSTSKLIQIALVGQPDLEEKLNSRELRQLKQRIAIRSQIRGLSAEESQEYIRHRLRLAGRIESEVFSPEAVELICRHAGGIPRSLNLLCDNALLVGFRRREKEVQAATVKEVLSDRGLVSPENEAVPPPAEVSARRSAKIITRKRFPASVRYGFTGILVVFFIIAAASGYLFLSNKKIKYGFGGAEVAAGIDGALTLKKEFEPLSGTPFLSSEQGVDRTNSALREKDPPSSAAVRTEPQRADEKIVSVVAGQTLYSILRTHYGHANATLVDYILKANPEITDPNLVEVDDRIHLPPLDEESLIQESSSGKFRIHLATFTRKVHAERFGQEGILRGKTVKIEKRSVSSEETWYRLYVGEYGDKEETRKALSILKKRGILGIYPLTS